MNLAAGSARLQIRDFRVGDEMSLHAVFYCAIHQTASRDYTAQQIDAWAPESFDREIWIERFGFVLVDHRLPVTRGVVPNAFMRKRLIQ